MKINRLTILITLAVAFIALAGSCKKKDKDTASNSFSGSISFDMPIFANPGDVITLTPYGIYREDGKSFGVSWSYTGSEKRDTTRYENEPLTKDPSYTLTVPNTLTTFTVTCYVYAEEYYSSSGSNSMIIVDDDGSLTNLPDMAELPVFKDGRDQRSYPYATIGDLDVFARNLAYSGAGDSYEGSSKVDWLFGRYYNHSEALTSCPDGWRLPSEEDWSSIAAYLDAEIDDSGSIVGAAGYLMGDGYFNSKKMWTFWPDVKITNSSLFSALPFGYATRTSSESSFDGIYKYAAWWGSDVVADTDNALYRYVFEDKPDVYLGAGNREYLLLPVRCVRSSE